MLGFVLAAGGAFIGYEAYKKYKLRTGKNFLVTPGHLFALGYQVGSNSGQGAAPDQAAAQAALNHSCPGCWNVLSSGPSATAGAFNVSAVFEGPGQAHLTADSLQSGFGAACTVVSVQDMGATPQV